MPNEKKHFVVLGLGTFGSALARRLSENGCRVTGVDSDRATVESLKSSLYEAVIADATQRTAIEQLAVNAVNAVFISLGGDLAPSLLAALHVKECGAKRIVVKGLSDEHGRILASLGVERVVFPKIEMAQNLADRMTWPNVLDYVPIDPEYSVVEFTVPTSLAGKTLLEADLRRSFHIWIIAIKDALTGKLRMFPDAEFRFTDDQLLVAIGKQDDLNRFREVE
jgi:trk system potassium uptake protein TrkA